MSSGLIWAGLGQGIANAGQSVGNAMMKKISDEEAMARLEKQAELADQRAEAKDLRKEQREEAKAKLDGENYSAALKAAEDMPAKRDAGLLSRASGMELSPEEMETVKNMPPEARKAYEESGMLKPRGDERLQQADDAIEAAGSKGASSNVMKLLRDKKTETLKAIESDNKVKEARIQSEAAAAALDKRLTSQEKIAAERNATTERAANTRAEATVRAVTSKTDKPADPIKERAQILKDIKEFESSAPKPPDPKRTDAGGKMQKEYQKQYDAWLKNTDDGKMVASLKERHRELSTPKSADQPSEKPKSDTQSDRKVGTTQVVASGPNKGKTAVWDGQGWKLK